MGGSTALVAAAILASSATASAQDVAPVSPPAPVAAAPTIAPQVLLAGTIVELEITQSVGSKISKRGDRFGIRLVEDLRLAGVVILAAGAEGEGEVTHAAPSKMGGGGGELMLAARFLDRDGVRVPLKAFKVGASGRNNSEASLVVAMVAGPFALFIHGGEVLIPSGTVANAKLAVDLAPPASTVTTSVAEKEPTP
ncbi:hypothetical protein ASD79_09735 [Caulobacter sp. Root655]|nr:hypothetical protein ASD79_09735 [Caulobacter sp. Root655]